jgi:hypothetical protein
VKKCRVLINEGYRLMYKLATSLQPVDGLF